MSGGTVIAGASGIAVAEIRGGRFDARRPLEEIVEEGDDQGDRESAQRRIDDDGDQNEQRPPPVDEHVAHESEVDLEHASDPGRWADAAL